MLEHFWRIVTAQPDREEHDVEMARIRQEQDRIERRLEALGVQVRLTRHSIDQHARIYPQKDEHL